MNDAPISSSIVPPGAVATVVMKNQKCAASAVEGPSAVDSSQNGQIRPLTDCSESDSGFSDGLLTPGDKTWIPATEDYVPDTTHDCHTRWIKSKSSLNLSLKLNHVLPKKLPITTAGREPLPAR